MKLATYQDGSRDGQLVLVSRDLTQAHYTHGMASRLQQVLDDWNFIAPQLQDLSTRLNQGKTRHAFAFDPSQCMAPLPRAFQWVQSGASSRLTALLGHWAGQAPAGVPWLEQGASDPLLGPREAMVLANPATGLDLGAGLAVITGDIAQGAAPAQALEGVRLMVLANHWRLHEGQPATQVAPGFSPVAVTPDELGEAWRGGRVRLPLVTQLNGRPLGQTDAGAAMGFHFGQCLARLAQVRRVPAGSLLGSGPLGGAEGATGAQCLAELRAREAQADLHTTPTTPWLRYGDRVQIEMRGADGLSVFGQIDQTVTEPE